MNMHCTFYGNQFTHQLGHALYMDIENLLALAPTPVMNVLIQNHHGDCSRDDCAARDLAGRVRRAFITANVLGCAGCN
jgi:hypothetical protein